MYKNLFILVSAAFLFVGCSKELDNINGVINTIGNIGQTVNGSSNGIKNEKISTVTPRKTRTDYGKISVDYVKDSKPQTALYINQCIHPQIGKVYCRGYIHAVTKDGWLVQDSNPIAVNPNARIVLAAGKYYLKMEDSKSARHYVTGEIIIKPFVSNYINVVLE